jgi:choline-glycine betaine transporter
MVDFDFIIRVFQFLITLTSIIGAFFYIHMGNWLQGLSKLERKMQMIENENFPEETRKQALFDLKWEIGEYDNPYFSKSLLGIDLYLAGLVFLSVVLLFTIPEITEIVIFFALPFYGFFIVFIISSNRVINKEKTIKETTNANSLLKRLEKAESELVKKSL